MSPQTARAFLASGAVYLVATLAMGREVLGSLGSRIASDAGDPVLTAAILVWNARTVPWTDAWFDFPAFYPVADVLTFSEHLLGLSVIFTPIFRVTGNAIAAYNLTFLATYVLCGLAMYALVWRLTRSASASFLAGLAYAFAPYRVAHIPHIQVLAAFWAPLALLGLHAYLETRKRRWLVLFAACWSLQAAANGYLLVFFSLLVGAWVLWFVVAQRRWRDLVNIAVAGVLGLLPLAPILVRFVAAHERYLLTRSPAEIATFSADVASVFCAPERLAAWGWINIGEPACLAERQLFPGLALVAICLVGLAALGRRDLRAEIRTGLRRGASALSTVLLAAALVMIASAVSVAAWGPWAWSAGPVAVTGSSVAKPFTRGILLLLAAVLCSPRVWIAVRTASVPWFYGLAAVVAWVCSWGPAPTLAGKAALAHGPYAWLMVLPGLDGLRAPARFWIVSVLCLSVLAGLVASHALMRRTGRLAGALATVFAAAALLADGWSTIQSAQTMPSPPRPDLLAGGVVLTLPLGVHHEPEIAAQFDAVLGGWRSVNGYSGYAPGHYSVLQYAAGRTDPFVLAPFLARGHLNVIVDERAPQFVSMVEAVPGAVEQGRGHGLRQYRIPQQGRRPPAEPAGERRSIASLSVSCVPVAAAFARDGDPATRWQCGPQRPGQAMTVDLGRSQTVGTVIPALGPFVTDFPRELQIETSIDGSTWQPAWKAGVLPEAMEGMLRDPATSRPVLAFTPRQARYVRLQLTSHDVFWYWSIAEVEIWSGGNGS